MYIYDFLKYEKQIIIAEKEYNSPEWHWESDINMWEGYMFWLVFSGTGTINIKNVSYSLSEGNLFLFDLKDNHICTQDVKNPMSVYMVFFSVDDNGLLSDKIQRGEIERLYNTDITFYVKIFEKICGEDINSPVQKLWFDAALSGIFKAPDETRSFNPEINRIYSAIMLRPEKKYSITRLSEQCGYSKSQFIRLFKKYKGITPYEHVINAKINMAKNMLLFSERSVSEIAESLQYSDINHFSKQFKSKTGYYPSEFRNNKIK